MFDLRRDDALDDFQRHLKIKQVLSQKTIDKHVLAVKNYLDYCEEILPDTDKALDYKEKMMDEDYSNSHINNNLKAIEYYYEFQDIEFEWNSLDRPKKRPRVLKESEVKKMLYSCESYRNYAIIKLLAASGIRASELCNLDVTDLDFEERTIFIEQGKGAKDGIARFNEKAGEAIQKYLDHREDDKKPLFLSRTGERLTRRGLLQLVKRVAKQADIENPEEINVHSFRHYFGTKMIENGADVSVLKELMRHDSIASTMRYLHLSGKALNEHYDRYMDNI